MNFEQGHLNFIKFQHKSERMAGLNLLRNWPDMDPVDGGRDRQTQKERDRQRQREEGRRLETLLLEMMKNFNK